MDREYCAGDDEDDDDNDHRMGALSLEDLDGGKQEEEGEKILEDPNFHTHTYWKLDDSHNIDDLLKEYEY